jgi:hypothetical protein
VIDQERKKVKKDAGDSSRPYAEIAIALIKKKSLIIKKNH